MTTFLFLWFWAYGVLVGWVACSTWPDVRDSFRESRNSDGAS